MIIKKTIVTSIFALSVISSIEAQNAHLVLHPSQAKDIIPKEIYGHFTEHLGRCVYGGIWVGPESEIENINGYRKDVFNAIKDLEVPVMRWPGGCFADEYHWMDGIGPLEKRKKIINNNWGKTVEDNSFGTHEFLNLCEMLNCDAYISGNVGSGTVEELSNWVEYMTADGESTMAELRRKNGRDKPWKVKYLGVGNENYGCGGDMEPEYYTSLFRRYAAFCKNHGDNQLFKISAGNDTHWTEVMAKTSAKQMNGISVHYYAIDWGKESNSENGGSATKFTPWEYYNILSKSLWIDHCIDDHSKVLDKYDPEKRIALILDEWGNWFSCEPGTNPGWLFQQNTMRDAIVASTTFDIFHRHLDRVKMSNIAQMVNVLQSIIFTDPEHPERPCVLTPTYHAFYMYKVHKEARHIPGELTCDYVGVDDKKVPCVSFTASLDKDNNLNLSLTNIDMEDSHIVDVSIDNMKVHGKISGKILTSKDIHDCNDFVNGRRVVPKEFKGARVENGHLVVNLPSHSIVTLNILTK